MHVSFNVAVLRELAQPSELQTRRLPFVLSRRLLRSRLANGLTSVLLSRTPVIRGRSQGGLVK